MTPGVQIRRDFAISYYLLRYCNFEFSVFFNSVQLFYDTNLPIFLELSFCPPELRSVGTFRISLTVFEI